MHLVCQLDISRSLLRETPSSHAAIDILSVFISCDRLRYRELKTRTNSEFDGHVTGRWELLSYLRCLLPAGWLNVKLD